MKSVVCLLQGLLDSIVEDAIQCFPDLSTDLLRDKAHLASLIESRGLPFMTVDLPAFGKHFDKCLSNELLTPSHIPGFGVRVGRSVIPRLFSGMLNRIFDDSGAVLDSSDPNSVLFVRQLCYFAKKYRMECERKFTHQTVQEYYHVEAKLVSPTLNWDGDDLVSGDYLRPTFRGSLERNHPVLPGVLNNDPKSHVPQAVWYLDNICSRVISSFGVPRYEELCPKHGPGAVSDIKGPARWKYSFPHWPMKLESLFPYDQFAHANWSVQEASEEDSALFRHEPPSKLIAVPKTQKGPRLIAAEPTAHQFIQQGLMALLGGCVARSVLRYCIDFHDQSHNGRRALQGSKDGEDVTVDLSSASDRLSCWVVERVFGSNLRLLRGFHSARTRYIRNDIVGDLPSHLKLRKFASQGSALTFPVQSICFALIAMACYLAVNEKRVTEKTVTEAAKAVRVFGDDIIVPKDVSGELIATLEWLGLKVNLSKTHLKGNFRESCGVDAYMGYDVTPAYVLEFFDESCPTSLASTVESSNNFHRKGFWHAADYLRSTVPAKIDKSLPITHLASGAFSLHSFVGSYYDHLKTRYNNELQRREYLAVKVSTKADRAPVEGWSSLLQYYTERPDPQNKWQSGLGKIPKSTMRLGWTCSDDLDSLGSYCLLMTAGPRR